MSGCFGEGAQIAIDITLPGCLVSTRIIAFGVNLGHLAEVFISFVHGKAILSLPFPSSTLWKSLCAAHTDNQGSYCSPPEGWKICINYLEIFFMGGLLLSFINLLIQSHVIAAWAHGCLYFWLNPMLLYFIAQIIPAWALEALSVGSCPTLWGFEHCSTYWHYSCSRLILHISCPSAKNQPFF